MKPFPQVPESERAYLGAVLRDSRVIDEAPLSPKDFHVPHHAALLRLVLGMVERDEPVDMVSVPVAVANTGNVEGFGGMAYVVGLPEACPSTAAAKHYAEQVRETARKRRLYTAAAEVVAKVDESDSSSLTQLLHEATESEDTAEKNTVPLSVALAQAMAAIRERARRGRPDGIPTGLGPLDGWTGGLGAGQLWILAARPGMGKTALAHQIARHVARRGAVLFHSLEMSAQELGERSLVSDTGIDAAKLKSGQGLTSALLEALEVHRQKLASLQLETDDRSGLTVGEICRSARRLHRQRGLSLVVVDYLQLLDLPNGGNRAQEVGDATRRLKVLARDLNVPVLLLSQLNRNLEHRTDKRPMPSDLRESGAIEQDADVILFVYRDAVYNEDADTGEAELILGKQRSGPTGSIKVGWAGGLYRFFEFD